MEQLRALQQRSAFLKTLQDAGGADCEKLAETLEVVVEALRQSFGSGAAERLGLLGCLQGLATPLLAKLVSTCPEPKPPPESKGDGKCEVSMEGVDLAQSALEDFVNSYFMFLQFP